MAPAKYIKCERKLCIEVLSTEMGAKKLFYA